MGAGGTGGGNLNFFLGLIMMIAGGYLLLNSIHVSNHFSMGYPMFSNYGMRVPSGFLLVPFIFGIGLIFYNYKNYWGWILAGGSIIMLIFGVITSLHFSMRRMTMFELITIFVLFVGGIGLFLSSFRNSNR